MTPSRLAGIVVLIVCAIGISACANTVRGVGKDLKGTARAVEDVAQ